MHPDAGHGARFPRPRPAATRTAAFLSLPLHLLGWLSFAPAATVTNRLYLFDDIPVYPWSGFMGASSGASLTVDTRNTAAAREGPFGVRIHTTGAESWCGVAVQCKENRWAKPGADFTGAAAIRFDIRGQSGGESVKVEAMDGLVLERPVLTASWQRLTLPLPASTNLASVNNLFTVVFEAPAPATILIDELAVLFPRPDGLTNGALPARIQGTGYNEIDSARSDADFLSIARDLHANTIRFWSPTDFTPATLDRAKSNDLKAIIAYWMPQTNAYEPQVDYTQPDLRAALMRSVTNFVAAHCPHPAVAAVCVGNEVLTHLAPATKTNTDAFATLIDQIAIQIHTSCPGLPVTYTDVNATHLACLATNAPNLDIFGSNAYGGIAQAIADYQAGSYGKPLLFLEYGCLGHWETDWTTYTDDERAEDYFDHWNLLKKHAIGGAAFTWLDKTEDGVSGWGIVATNRLPRPQFRKIAEAYAPIAPPRPTFQADGTLRWNSKRGEAYTVQTSASLLTNSWSECGSAFEGTGAPIETNLPAVGEPRRFYRIRAEK